MVDFLNYDGISYVDIRKKLLTLMEEIAFYRRHIIFVKRIFGSM